jgi:hypothetical protein
MKLFRAVLLSVLGTILAVQLPFGVTPVQAENDKVTWEDIAGVTTPVIADTTPGHAGLVVANDVQTIPPGGRPWFVQSGNASFRPVNGELRFKVKGLVLLGGGATGTPDGVTQVKGTIVCNGPVVVDADPVALSPQGDAEFHGRVTPVPSCVNPIFLIRIGPGTPGSITDRWIAAGVVRRPGVE